MSALSQAEKMLPAVLNPGERVLWSQTPRAGAWAMRAMPLAVIGLLWLAFVVGFAAGIGPVDSWAVVLLLPFLVVGGALLLGPVLAARRASRSLYAITNRRAIMLVAGFVGASVTVRSFGAGDLRGVVLRVASNGVGDLIFERRMVPDSDSSHEVEFGLFGVTDARRVERLVIEIASNGAESYRGGTGARRAL